jgi:hypothetical protein
LIPQLLHLVAYTYSTLLLPITLSLSLSTQCNGVKIMRLTSHLLVLFIVALVHIAIYMAIVNAHEENMRDAQASTNPTQSYQVAWHK